ILTVSNLLVDGVPGFNEGFFATNSLPFTVPMNGSVAIGVVASNLVAGSNEVTLSIVTDGARQTLDVDVRNVVSAPPPVIIFSTDPPGMVLRIDGTNLVGPVAYTIRDDTNGPDVWSSASDHVVEALQTNVVSGQVFFFSTWDPVEDRVFALNTS